VCNWYFLVKVVIALVHDTYIRTVPIYARYLRMIPTYDFYARYLCTITTYGFYHTKITNGELALQGNKACKDVFTDDLAVAASSTFMACAPHYDPN
jgi:hypothetical protein